MTDEPDRTAAAEEGRTEREGAQEAGTRQRRRGPRLSLSGPLPAAARSDRPETWGDKDESDAERLGFYVDQRPPHHGQ